MCLCHAVSICGWVLTSIDQFSPALTNHHTAASATTHRPRPCFHPIRCCQAVWGPYPWCSSHVVNRRPCAGTGHPRPRRRCGKTTRRHQHAPPPWLAVGLCLCQRCTRGVCADISAPNAVRICCCCFLKSAVRTNSHTSPPPVRSLTLRPGLAKTLGALTTCGTAQAPTDRLHGIQQPSCSRRRKGPLGKGSQTQCGQATTCHWLPILCFWHHLIRHVDMADTYPNV